MSTPHLGHIADELPRLLTGEAGRDVVLAAAQHLRSCVDCQQELVSAVVAHASLTSAHRFAPDLMVRRIVDRSPWDDASDDADDLPRLPRSGAGSAPMGEDSDDLLDGASATGPASGDDPADGAPAQSDIDGRGITDTGASEAIRRSTSAPMDLPDLTAMFAQVRREAEQAATDASGRPAAAVAAEVPSAVQDDGSAVVVLDERRSRRLGRIALVAAAVAVVGVGAAIARIETTGDTSQPTARTIALAAFESGTHDASARMTADGAMTIDASSLPTLVGKRYEVWLTDSARSRMQPVGWIGAGGVAHLDVPPALLSRYSDVEVSVQALDSPSYRYSGQSVLRGAYRT